MCPQESYGNHGAPHAERFAQYSDEFKETQTAIRQPQIIFIGTFSQCRKQHVYNSNSLLAAECLPGWDQMSTSLFWAPGDES